MIAGEAKRESARQGPQPLSPGGRAGGDAGLLGARAGAPRLGLESIYEGYLHYGRPRLFAPADSDTAILLGDYLYAHGLVRVAAHGQVTVVADLAEPPRSAPSFMRRSGRETAPRGLNSRTPRIGRRQVETDEPRQASRPTRRRCRRSPSSRPVPRRSRAPWHFTPSAH